MNGVPVASTIYTGKDATIYRYHRHGLLDDVPHNRLMHGTIIAQTEDEGASHRVLKAAGPIFYIGRKLLKDIYWKTACIDGKLVHCKC